MPTRNTWAYHIFGQGYRPVVAYAEQMIHPIRHPKDPPLLLSLRKSQIGHISDDGLVYVIDFVKLHQLYHAERSTGTHPCLPVVGSYRFVSCDQNPSLNLLRVNRAPVVASYTQALQKLFCLLIKGFMQMLKLS